MGFLNVLIEKLDSQATYQGLSGKFETRFTVEGVDYALVATTTAGDGSEVGNLWMLEFENLLTHRIGRNDNNPKLPQAFAEAVDQFVKERSPYSFFTFGSSEESLQKVLESVKKKVKKYNVVDDTLDKKNEDTNEVVQGNPVGRILFTKTVSEETTSEEKANTKNDKLDTRYEEPKDIKTNKTHMTFPKSDKLDKKGNDVAYDQKFDTYTDPKLFDQKFESYDYKLTEALSVPEQHQMKIALSTLKMDDQMALVAGGMNLKDAYLFLLNKARWSDKKIQDYMRNVGQSSEDIQNLMKKIHLPKFESFVEFKAKKLNEGVDLIEEGKAASKLASKAKKILNNFKDLKAVSLEFAGDVEKLKAWLEKHPKSMKLAWDLVRHMVDKKELSYEEEILNGTLLDEGTNILDTIKSKMPSALTAAALILTIMSSGQKVFGQNDQDKDILKKAKSNAEQIVDIIKNAGGKIAKEVGKDAEIGGKIAKVGIEKVAKDIEKPAKKAAKQLEKPTKELGANIAKGFGKGMEVGKEKATKIIANVGEVGDKISSDAKEKAKKFKPFSKAKEVTKVKPSTETEI